MRYEADRACGWRIRPSVVPSGYKLRLSFDFVNTERGYDTVHLYDGDGGAAFSGGPDNSGVGTRTWDFEPSAPWWLRSEVTPLYAASGYAPAPEVRLSIALG